MVVHRSGVGLYRHVIAIVILWKDDRLRQIPWFESHKPFN